MICTLFPGGSLGTSSEHLARHTQMQPAGNLGDCLPCDPHQNLRSHCTHLYIGSIPACRIPSTGLGGGDNWWSRSEAWVSGPHQTDRHFPRLDELCRQWEPRGPARPGREASGARAHNGPFLPSLIETVECRIFKQLYIHRLQDERRLPKDEVRWAINA